MLYTKISTVLVIILLGTGFTCIFYFLEYNPICRFYCPGKVTRDFTNNEDGRCLKNYFQDILLVIVYHYPSYSTSSFIIPQYKDAFPHIVVCGPKHSTRYQILVSDMGPRGYYSYDCLARAMHSYSGYKGYLFVNDDMIVNWWNFVTLDKDKIWQGARINHQAAHEIGRRPIPDDWMWWSRENGAVSCENAYKKVESLANDLPTPIDIRNLLQIHFRNGRNKTMCFRTWSDFAYIPGKFSQGFKLLDAVFLENKVFLEIALPTIMSLLSDWDEWEKVYGIYLTEIYGFQDFSNIKYVWPQFKEDVAFLHPVKFFGEKGLRNRKLFETRVVAYARQLTTC